MPYRRSQEGPPAPGVGARQSRLQQERPEAGTRPVCPGWLGSGAEEGRTWGAPGAALTLRGAQGEAAVPSGLRLLSPWKRVKEPVVQIHGPLSYGGRLCPKGRPGVCPLHHCGLRHHPQYSRFSKLWRQEATKSRYVDPLPILKSPHPGTPRFRGRRKQVALGLWPPQPGLPAEPGQVLPATYMDCPWCWGGEMCQESTAILT